MLAPFAAVAGECGRPAPDHVAHRSVEIGDTRFETWVRVSGERQREEVTIEGRKRVTLIRPDGVLTFDPDARTGFAAPAPPKPQARTRNLDSIGPDGAPVRVTQFERDGAWIDLSRTVCRPDGIMLQRDFVTVDRTGKELRGHLTQDRIAVGPLPADLFEKPAGIRIVQSPTHAGPSR